MSQLHLRMNTLSRLCKNPMSYGQSSRCPHSLCPLQSPLRLLASLCRRLTDTGRTLFAHLEHLALTTINLSQQFRSTVRTISFHPAPSPALLSALSSVRSSRAQADGGRVAINSIYKIFLAMYASLGRDVSLICTHYL